MSPLDRPVLLFAAVLAAGTWWLNNRLNAPEPVEERPAPDGFYMRGAEITTPDLQGRPHYRLIAEEIKQLALGGATMLRDVRVEYNVYSPSPWLLTAPEGRVSGDQRALRLWGGVEILGDSGDQGPARLSTPYIEVDIETNVAHTSAPVELLFGNHEVRGVGLVAHLLEERLQLKSEVHGRFLP